MTSPTTQAREAVICAGLALGLFLALMTFGFQLRFGALPWEMM